MALSASCIAMCIIAWCRVPMNETKPSSVIAASKTIRLQSTTTSLLLAVETVEATSSSGVSSSLASATPPNAKSAKSAKSAVKAEVAVRRPPTRRARDAAPSEELEARLAGVVCVWRLRSMTCSFVCHFGVQRRA